MIGLESILFIIGGVVLGYFLSYVKSRFEMRGYKKEIKRYEEHLNTQMKITSEGNKKLEEESQRLKKENENLRISLQTLGQKAGRAEIKLLNIYDSALRKMFMRAPAYSSAWEICMQEAEAEYEANEKGFKSILKKVFRPSLNQQTDTTQAKEISEFPEEYEGK